MHGLKSHNLAERFDPEDISDPDVNERRSKPEPIHGRPVHDYVPLYFRAKNPMLCRRQDRQKDLAILCIDRSVMFVRGAIFADG